MNIADLLLRSDYTIYITKNKEKDELVGTKIKKLQRGLHADELPKDAIIPIQKLNEIQELLENDYLLQVTRDGYSINSVIGTKKTEGPYCETKYLEVENEAKGFSYYESLVNLNIAIEAEKKEVSIKSKDLKEYKKLYEGVDKYE